MYCETLENGSAYSAHRQQLPAGALPQGQQSAGRPGGWRPGRVHAEAPPERPLAVMSADQPTAATFTLIYWSSVHVVMHVTVVYVVMHITVVHVVMHITAVHVVMHITFMAPGGDLYTQDAHEGHTSRVLAEAPPKRPPAVMSAHQPIAATFTLYLLSY
jgi:hypothetical protein